MGGTSDDRSELRVQSFSITSTLSSKVHTSTQREKEVRHINGERGHGKSSSYLTPPDPNNVVLTVLFLFQEYVGHCRFRTSVLSTQTS